VVSQYHPQDQLGKLAMHEKEPFRYLKELLQAFSALAKMTNSVNVTSLNTAATQGTSILFVF
jgi:hypothetical protein